MSTNIIGAHRADQAQAPFGSAWFAHWHPVARSRDLGRKPIARRVLDREIVLFRSEAGRIGAMSDRCPHRGMRLSKGCVRGGRLQCPYHGWSYNPEGVAFSPGNPTLQLTVPTLAVAERYGLVWVKDPASTDALPEWAHDGYEFVHSGSWHVRAPCEVMLDNFTEVEHTGIAHWQFGYEEGCVGTVANETRCTPNTVEVRTAGPQKKLSWPGRAFLGLQRGDHLICEWVTEFTPLRCVWYMGWEDPKSQAVRARCFRAVAYFNPIGKDACQLSTMYFCKTGAQNSSIVSRLSLPVLRYVLNREIKLDIHLVENVTPHPIGPETSYLSRFDKAIVEQRRRLQAGVNAV
jgi:phenylpropionate dioxygenase-like ring-hydroxylating dioxygenase large terminal subunit